MFESFDTLTDAGNGSVHGNDTVTIAGGCETVTVSPGPGVGADAIVNTDADSEADARLVCAARSLRAGGRSKRR